ncbi:MAG: hypothetical protein WD534_05510 [Phycisphaeraceae bacterium]
MFRRCIACFAASLLMAIAACSGPQPEGDGASASVPAKEASPEVVVQFDPESTSTSVGDPMFLMPEGATIPEQPDADLTYAWSATGPGEVSFAMPNRARTNAVFPVAGSYTVTLTVEGAGASGSASLTVEARAKRRLELLAPEGGESFEPGEVVQIRWSANEVEEVWLLFSDNGGASWRQIARPVDDEDPRWGNFSWTVPNVASDKAQVALRAYIGEGYFRSQPFTIHGSLPPEPVPSARDRRPDTTLADARSLLGPAADSARILAQHGRRIVRIDVATGEQTVLAEVSEDAADDMSRAWWSPDGSRVVYAAGGKAYLVDAGGGTPQRVLEDREQVHDPNWWRDPDTGQDWIVYATSGGKFRYAEKDQEPHGATFRTNFATGETVRLADVPGDGGLSIDGAFLAEAYGDVLMVNTASQEAYLLNDGEQGCNGTISPDNTCRIMHLALPHDWIHIRDRFDRPLRRIEIPEGSEEWQTPRWSNHPDWAMAILRYGGEYYLALVRISDSEIVVLGDLGVGWRSPHLWLEGVDRPEEGEDAHARWQALAPDAALEQGRAELERLKSVNDPFLRRGGLRALVERLPETPVAAAAREALDDPALSRELEAARLAREVEILTRQLAPVDGEAHWSNDAWKQRNAATIARIVPLLETLRAEHSESFGLRQAEALTTAYGLPVNAEPPPAPGTIEVEAVLEEVSPVPPFRQIAPYREVITLARYRVVRVIDGSYDEEEIAVGFWGMRDAEHTPVTDWEAGKRQTLRLVPLMSLPELGQQQQVSAAVPLELEPYWAVTIDGNPTDPAPPSR